MLAAAPAPDAPPRCVDIYSYGNRSAPVHQRLLELSERSNFFYLYDLLSSTDSRVKSWREHRSLIANTVKRSRYFIAFNPASLGGEKSGKIAGEQVLASRLFEGAAGGAVILGTAPDCPEFKEQFPWPDAVIEISPDGSDVEDIIEAFDRQDDRIAQLRAASVTGSLLRHDWAYRWETILSKVGLPHLPQLDHRKSVLADLASRSRKTCRQIPRLTKSCQSWRETAGCRADVRKVTSIIGVTSSRFVPPSRTMGPWLGRGGLPRKSKCGSF